MNMQSGQRPDLGRAAQWYAEKMRWPVAPAHWMEPNGNCSCGSPECSSPGKHPIASLVPHGGKDATRDLGKIRQWWGQYPQANIIVPTGSQSGIWTLDVDTVYGGPDSLHNHGLALWMIRRSTGSLAGL